MLKIPFAGCLGLSSAISTQFTPEMCAAASHRKKILKTHIFGVQASRSFKVIDVGTPRKPVTAVLVMMRSKSSICNRSLAIDWTTVAETAGFQGVPKFDALVRRTT